MNGTHVDPANPPTVPLATATALTLPAGPPGALPDGTVVPESTTTLIPAWSDTPAYHGLSIEVGWVPEMRAEPRWSAPARPGRRQAGKPWPLSDVERQQLAALAVTTTQPAATRAMPAPAPAPATAVLPAEPPTAAIVRPSLLHEPHTGPRPIDDLIRPELGAGGAS